MYRFGVYFLAVLALLLGLVIGTLNSNAVSVDLFWVQFQSPLGAVLLIAFVLGILFGLCSLFVFRVIPQRLTIKRNQKKLRQMEAVIARKQSESDVPRLTSSDA